jgi:hypothetical protein
VGHIVDHIARDDLLWPLTLQSLPFITVSLATYMIIGFGLYLYLKNKVGPPLPTRRARKRSAVAFQDYSPCG